MGRAACITRYKKETKKNKGTQKKNANVHCFHVSAFFPVG